MHFLNARGLLEPPNIVVKPPLVVVRKSDLVKVDGSTKGRNRPEFTLMR